MNKLTVSSFSIPSYPIKDLLIVKSITQLSSEIYYSILDAKGTEIISNKIIESYEGLIKISVDSLKRGMYLLRISDNESYVVSSFVKA